MQTICITVPTAHPVRMCPIVALGRRLSLVGLLAIVSLPSLAQTPKLKIVASFLPAYCLAVQVGGNHTEMLGVRLGRRGRNKEPTEPEFVDWLENRKGVRPTPVR